MGPKCAIFLVIVVEARRAKNKAQKQLVRHEILRAIVGLAIVVYLCKADPCCGRSFERHLEKEVKGVMF